MLLISPQYSLNIFDGKIKSLTQAIMYFYRHGIC